MNIDTLKKLYELKGIVDTAIELSEHDDSINYTLLLKIQSNILNMIELNKKGGNIRVI